MLQLVLELGYVLDDGLALFGLGGVGAGGDGAVDVVDGACLSTVSA